MLEYTVDQIKIKIDLSPGIWCLPSDSAIGKTRLSVLLTKLAIAGLPVLSYTYSDTYTGRDLETLLSQKPYELIMLDRYDKYLNMSINKLIECAETAVILVDCKRSNKLVYFDGCTLWMDKGIIEVS